MTKSARELQDKAFDLYLKNRYSQAKKVLLESIAAYPEFVESHLLLGQIYFFSRRPDYDAALKEFREVRLQPSWNEGHQWLGSAFQQEGDLDSAIESYQNARRLAPNDSRPHVALGLCFTERGHFGEAIKMLKRGLALKPYCTEADV